MCRIVELRPNDLAVPEIPDAHFDFARDLVVPTNAATSIADLAQAISVAEECGADKRQSDNFIVHFESGGEAMGCQRRFKTDPLCRLKTDPGKGRPRGVAVGG